MQKHEGANLWFLEQNQFLHFRVSVWNILQPSLLSIYFSVSKLIMCMNNVSLLIGLHR